MDGEEERLSAREADLERYETLKVELTSFTLAIAGVTTVSVAAAYSPEAAGSYAVGAAGGLLYLRLLSRSVDSTSGGAQGLGDVIEGTIGGQRLLVPGILVVGWNRWNALAAPVTGVELQILPMLAGFFTYKARTGPFSHASLAHSDTPTRSWQRWCSYSAICFRDATRRSRFWSNERSRPLPCTRQHCVKEPLSRSREL